MIKWDEKHQVFTDYMGYPLSRAAVLEMRQSIKTHLKRSAPDLAHIANQRLAQEMPHYPPYPPEKFE